MPTKDWQGNEQLEIEDNEVNCPWWKTKIDIWNPEKGCLSVCEYNNGTYQGQGIFCMYKRETGE